MEKKSIKRKISLLLTLIMLACLLAGCGGESPIDDEPDVKSSGDVENPFQQGNPLEGFMNAIGHGSRTLNLDENNQRLPWVYAGQDIQIEYFVNAYGQAKNVGFLLFVDGVAQPYKVDDANSPYEYMHIFELAKDGVDLPFAFIFSPITGKQGETLNLTVISVYYPSFMPDMDISVSYGGYHEILSANFQISFNMDATAPNRKLYEAIRSVTISKEPVTNQLMEAVTNSGLREIDTDTFNSEIFSLIYYDGSLKTDNYKVGGSDTLRIMYKLCGHAGLEYGTTFYVNHQPISSADGVSIHTTIEKGFASVIEVEIDINKLSDFNTFYVVSSPLNARDYPDGIFETIKSRSILLYLPGSSPTAPGSNGENNIPTQREFQQPSNPNNTPQRNPDGTLG